VGEIALGLAEGSWHVIERGKKEHKLLVSGAATWAEAGAPVWLREGIHALSSWFSRLGEVALRDV